jgi:outer membrane protein assembly factor BamE (lipoprotein component of BamABCDE complex)
MTHDAARKIAVNLSKTMRLALLSIILAPAAAVLPGCPAGTYGSVITPGQMAVIVRGKTTKAELLSLLGEPDDVKNLGGGKEEWSYVRATVGTHYNFGSYGNYTKTETWIILKSNIVEAYGEREAI